MTFRQLKVKHGDFSLISYVLTNQSAASVYPSGTMRQCPGNHVLLYAAGVGGLQASC